MSEWSVLTIQALKPRAQGNSTHPPTHFSLFFCLSGESPAGSSDNGHSRRSSGLPGLSLSLALSFSLLGEPRHHGSFLKASSKQGGRPSPWVSLSSSTAFTLQLSPEAGACLPWPFPQPCSFRKWAYSFLLQLPVPEQNRNSSQSLYFYGCYLLSTKLLFCFLKLLDFFYGGTTM